jgi:hypothetical protein
VFAVIVLIHLSIFPKRQSGINGGRRSVPMSPPPSLTGSPKMQMRPRWPVLLQRTQPHPSSGRMFRFMIS